MTEKIEKILAKLQGIKSKKEALDYTEKIQRSKLLEILGDENLESYKGELATIAVAKRVNVNVLNKAGLIERLKADRLVKYYKTVEEVSAEFISDAKANILPEDFKKEVELVCSDVLQIRFARDEQKV